MALEARRLQRQGIELVGAGPNGPVFGLEAAGRLLTEVLAPWVQDLNLLVEAVEAGRPVGAAAEWLPGAVVRLPFSSKLCRGGVMCPQALLAFADTAMTLACAA